MTTTMCRYCHVHVPAIERREQTSATTHTVSLHYRCPWCLHSWRDARVVRIAPEQGKYVVEPSMAIARAQNMGTRRVRTPKMIKYGGDN